MCEIKEERKNIRTIPLSEAVGTVLAHDITEIREGFKGRAFKKGHIIREEDIEHLRRLGKEHLYVLNIGPDDVHEDEAALTIAEALIGEGVELEGEPKEGRVNMIAARDGLLKINREVLLNFNTLGEVMCATLHNNTVVRKGQVIAGTRAIPLIVKREIVDRAVSILESCKSKNQSGVIEVKRLKRPRAGVVITGNEVYYGRIKDAFAPVIIKKIEEYKGEIVGISYAPDDVNFIEARLREFIYRGADLLITTGGMSVDPDDVTRFAVARLGAIEMAYGSAVLPGAMFLVAYIRPVDRQISRAAENSEANSSLNTTELSHCSSVESIPLIGIPACAMYHKTTVFDIILPRILAGERIGRYELAELGHGGLCLNCKECRFPLCPFGK
ncbi:MAG: molybdopterin-binding protein [Thermodesulfovibrionales bacterium]|nr:molybdopterin-binding protein [Thermodesulfovibrionales bacterium]